MPKRSSGCDLCRKRKVRCDEARPRCQRCTNFGAECPGYTRTESVVFRHQTSTTTSKARPRRMTRPTSQELAWGLPPSDSMVSDISEASLALAHSFSPFDINTTHETRSMFLAGFLDTYLPRSQGLPSDIENQYAYLLELPSSDNNNIAFTTAVDALTVVQLGTHYGDQNLLHQSRLIYGKALAYLYRALLHPKLQAQDETLAAISILGLCDFFRGTSQNGTGWLSHAAGAKGLLKHRGPKSMQSPLAMKLLLNQRYTALIGGFFARKAVYFDHPEWLNITADLAARNYWVAITDIMVQVPGLLEDTDSICTPLSDQQAVRDISPRLYSLLERYNKLQRRLEDWYASLTSSADGEICQSVDVMEMTDFWNLCPDLAFPTVLHFPSFHFALLYALYSYASYVLCKNAADVRSHLSSPHSSPPKAQQRTLPSLIILRHLAHHHITQLARSVPYLCTSHSASVGRIQCLAFLFFVQDYFSASSTSPKPPPSVTASNGDQPQEHSPQYLWCWKIYTALAGRGIVPPRATIHANTNQAGHVADADQVPDDDVGDSIDKVVERLGVGVNSVDISEDGHSRTYSEGAGSADIVTSREDSPPSYHNKISKTRQQLRPSPEFLKKEADLETNKWQWDDFEVA